MAMHGAEAPLVRRGRKPKFTVEELERRTLDAAATVLVEAGVTGGLDAIRIERIVVSADVPRAATYKFWEARGDGTPQENLRRAAVIEAIRDMPAGNAENTGNYALELLQGNNERLNSTDPVIRKQLRSDVIRDVAGYNFGLLQDQRWRVYKTLTSSIGTQTDPELRQAVADGEESLLLAYGNLFENLADLFKLQLRSPFEMRHFTMSVYALNEGLSNRVGRSFNDNLVTIDGHDWTTFAIGFEALVDHYFQDTEAT